MKTPPEPIAEYVYSGILHDEESDQFGFQIWFASADSWHAIRQLAEAHDFNTNSHNFEIPMLFLTHTSPEVLSELLCAFDSLLDDGRLLLDPSVQIITDVPADIDPTPYGRILTTAGSYDLLIYPLYNHILVARFLGL